MAGPILKRTYPYQIFYIKMYWSKYGMDMVLLQAYESVKAINSDSQEKYGGKCEFNKSLEGMRLRKFISYQDQQYHHLKSQDIVF